MEFLKRRNLYIQIKIHMINWFKTATNQNRNYKITGDYKFHIKCECDSIETNSMITVTAFTNKTQQSTIPCQYHWWRCRNGLKEEVPKFKGSSFICEVTDIGSVIQVGITSMDVEYGGGAMIQFEPVKLDAQVKREISSTLSTGSATINGMVCLGDQEKQCQLKIFEDLIKIYHLGSELMYAFEYSFYEPRIEIVSKDPTKIQFSFSQRYKTQLNKFMQQLFKTTEHHHKIEVKFRTRTQKDTVMLLIKAYFIKKELKNSAIIQKIQRIDYHELQNIDYVYEIEVLKRDLEKVIDLNNQNEAERNNLRQQVDKLEKDKQNIIFNFNKIIENKFQNADDMNKSYSVLTNKRDEFFTKKCKSLENQNFDLNERLKKLTVQVDQIKFNAEIMKGNQTVHQPNMTQSNFFDHGFTRKKLTTQGTEQTNFFRILDQLDQSHLPQQFEENKTLKNELEKIKQENLKLEKKLQKSFYQIDSLEKELYQQNLSLHQSNSNSVRVQIASDSRQTHNKKVVDKLVTENSNLKRLNNSLADQNKHLHQQLSLSVSRVIAKSAGSPATSPSTYLQKQSKEQKKLIETLKREIIEIKKKNQKNLQDKNHLEEKFKRKIVELESQIKLYRRNQDSLNRSQYLSMEMDNFNEEQMNVLKEHNEFLLGENERLAKACEKYMSQVKLVTKLRQQNLQLKEKLNSYILKDSSMIS